jgi:hypothetical protein
MLWGEIVSKAPTYISVEFSVLRAGSRVKVLIITHATVQLAINSLFSNENFDP